MLSFKIVKTIIQLLFMAWAIWHLKKLLNNIKEPNLIWNFIEIMCKNISPYLHMIGDFVFDAMWVLVSYYRQDPKYSM